MNNPNKLLHLAEAIADATPVDWETESTGEGIDPSHLKNLRTLAEVEQVLYPGLESHPGHSTARRQMTAFGGIVTLELRGGLEAAERFFDRLQLVARAASLGGVESLASLPIHTSHHGLSEPVLRAAGIDAGMVRLSIGVEDEADLVADLEQALAG